jgi:hypothetical protein
MRRLVATGVMLALQRAPADPATTDADHVRGVPGDLAPTARVIAEADRRY